MKNFFRYFNWGLAFTTILAIVLIFCFDFIFFQQTEIFSGASKIGQIIYSLLLSYISAYIFYLLTVYYKEYNTKEIIRIPLNKDIENLLKSYYSLINTISKSTGIIIENYFAVDQIEDACQSIDTITQPLNPYIGNDVKLPNNWITYLNVHKDVIREGVDSILNLYLENTDYRIVDLLSKIKRCDYFALVNIADQRKTEYLKFSCFFPTMEEYINLMKQLDELNKKLLS